VKKRRSPSLIDPASKLLSDMWVFLAELVLVIAAVALATSASNVSRIRWIARMNQFIRRLAARKTAAVFGIFVLSLAARITLLPVVPVPTPRIHDEFSHLLAADTYASGRLTNPTHPFWRHFETFHIQHHPSYMSMYPPASGMMLALGKRTFGIPWAGVLIATAGMCAAITWMLQAWLPPYWALMGGLLALMRIGLYSYWVNSYWGGALPALAGAVFIGALTRFCRKPSLLHGILLPVSVGILATTRMYEGALLVGAAVVSMAVHGHLRKVRLTRLTVIPMVLALAGIAAAMLQFNQTVYGNAMTLPYSINRDTYAAAQLFIWQKPNPVPEISHAPMRDFFGRVELERFNQFRTPYGFAVRTALKALHFYLFFIGPLLTIPLLFIRYRDKRMKPLTSIGLLMIPGVLAGAWFAPHYLSPATCLVYALLLQSMRRLNAVSLRGARALTAPAVLLLVVGASMTCFVAAASWSRAPLTVPPLSWCGWTYRESDRGDLIKILSTHPGRHLVIVRYEPKHDPSNEYVYNEANIDLARIVWAREMYPQSNQALIAYYQDRQAWVFEPDLSPPKLTRLK